MVAVAAVATGLAANSWAADQSDPMAGYVGNTLLSMNQPHYVIRVWFYPNGTFKEFKASHDDTNGLAVNGWDGTWTVQGTAGAYQLCKKYTPSFAPKMTDGCSSIVPHKVGDVWRVTYSNGPFKGTTETFTITPGRATEG
jgi:hypothetical protein